MIIMTKENIVTEKKSATAGAREDAVFEKLPPKARFQRDYANFFSRLTRYVHNGDMNDGVKTANEFKAAAAEAGATGIADLVTSIKSALYEGNTRKASALLDEINIESSRYFMKTSTGDITARA